MECFDQSTVPLTHFVAALELPRSGSLLLQADSPTSTAPLPCRYIPDAAQFTSGGRFAKHESGMWDTPMIASSALKWLLDANGDKLKDVPLRGKDHKDFGDLVSMFLRGREESVAGRAESLRGGSDSLFLSTPTYRSHTPPPPLPSTLPHRPCHPHPTAPLHSTLSSRLASTTGA